MEVIQFVTSVLIIAFFVGMIRPSWVRVDSRVKVLVYYFVPVIILIGVFGEDPNAKNEQNMTIEQAKREIAKLKESKAELEQEANETIAELEEEKNESVTELQKEVNELKAKEAEKQEEIKSEPILWYQGGTLQNATKEEWQKATDENKLATSADFASRLPAVVEIIEQTGFSDKSLKPFAKTTKECIDKHISDKRYDFDNIVNTCLYVISLELQERREKLYN